MSTGKSDQVPRLRIGLRQLEVFVATARAGSTRAAAERVARSQSAASAALAELESALGVALFDRVRQRLVLNEQGRALLPRAASLLDQALELQQAFGAGQATPLRLAASMTIGEVLLPELVAGWQARHPAGPVQLQIGNTREVIAAVTELQVDLGFIEGAQTHPDLALLPWRHDEMVVVAAAGHPLAQLRRVPREALRQARWVLREPGSGSRELAERWLIEHLGQIDLAFELGSLEAIKRLVAAGTGLACLSEHAVASAVADGSLVVLKTTLPPVRRRLAIVTHRGRRLGRATEDFLQHCLAADGLAGRARG